MPGPRFLALLFLALPWRAWSQDDSLRPHGLQRYAPPSHNFYCDVPAGWKAFETEDGYGPVVHLIGPEDPGAQFSAGIDVRWSEKGSPGYEPYKKFLEEMKRPDERVTRASTPVRVMRVSGVMARFFEVTETRRLPEDGWPGAPVELHRYVAILPAGESYFTISLASVRDHYLEYRDTFLDFVKNFKPLGS